MIRAVYAHIYVKCNVCPAQGIFCPGMQEKNKELGLLEMLSPEYLIETIGQMGASANYPSQEPGWRISEDGNAFCPKHA